MPKRKRHIKMPNGYGSIRFLGSGRALPYAVHPPCTQRTDTGTYIRPKPLCYVPDWYTGFAVLTAYHSGNYKPGMELDLKYDSDDVDAFCQKVLSHSVYQADTGTSLGSVYKSFDEWKFGENAPKELSSNSRYTYRQGYNYLSVLKDRPINSIKIGELQNIVNECDKGKQTRSNIVMTAKQIWRYAMQYGLCEKDVAGYLVVPSGRESIHGVPFTDDELKRLWKDKDDPICRLILIMCYSGFRVSALPKLEQNTDEMYFKGGLKTIAGKNRIVPIHSAIQPFCPFTVPPNYKNKLRTYFETHGYDHTSHDCRHTFSMLCERYKVHEPDRKRMLGHSFGSDLTNAVYGHRTIEELRTEIEKIKAVQ